MSAKPFLFDSDFEVETPIDEEPELETPPEPTFSEEELQATRQAAYADGFAAGEAQGRAAVEATIASTAETTRAALQSSVDQAFALAEREVEETVQTASIAAARSLALAFPQLGARVGHDEIRAVISEALARAHDEARLVFRLSETDYEDLADDMSALAQSRGYPGKVVVLEDGDLDAGDVRVEWAEGGLARDVGALAKTIASALETVAAPQSTPAITLSPTTEAEAHV